VLLADLILEESEEKLPQMMDAIRLNPEMLWQTARRNFRRFGHSTPEGEPYLDQVVHRTHAYTRG